MAKLSGMAYPMVLFGAVIFLGAILNASLIGVIERQREIATYRVLGYRPMEVGAMFLRENLVQNIAGIVLGLPLGWELLTAMCAQYSNDMYVMPVIMFGKSWIMSVGLALAFVFISQVFVQRAICKLDWLEALSVKE